MENLGIWDEYGNGTEVVGTQEFNSGRKNNFIKNNF